MHSAKPLACVCTKVLAAEFVISRMRWGDPASGAFPPKTSARLALKKGEVVLRLLSCIDDVWFHISWINLNSLQMSLLRLFPGSTDHVHAHRAAAAQDQALIVKDDQTWLMMWQQFSKLDLSVPISAEFWILHGQEHALLRQIRPAEQQARRLRIAAVEVFAGTLPRRRRRRRRRRQGDGQGASARGDVGAGSGVGSDRAGSDAGSGGAGSDAGTGGAGSDAGSECAGSSAGSGCTGPHAGSVSGDEEQEQEEEHKEDQEEADSKSEHSTSSTSSSSSSSSSAPAPSHPQVPIGGYNYNSPTAAARLARPRQQVASLGLARLSAFRFSISFD